MKFAEAKKILNKGGDKYTDEEIKKIIKIIEQFVKLDLEQLKNNRPTSLDS